MSEEPGKYQDEIGRQLSEIAAQMRQRDAGNLSRAMKTLQRILANALDVQPSEITRQHMVNFLREAPDREILRWRGISRKTLDDLRKEIGSGPDGR